MAKKDYKFQIITALIITTLVLVSALVYTMPPELTDEMHKEQYGTYDIDGQTVVADVLLLQGEDNDLFYEIVQRHNTEVLNRFEGLWLGFTFDLNDKTELAALKQDLERNGFQVSYDAIHTINLPK